MKRSSLLQSVLFLFLCAAGAAEEASRSHVLPKLSGDLVLDGDLSDPLWAGALRIDDFYEISPGDNTLPVVPTVALLGYDSRFLYVAVHCYDPEPDRIRASVSDRDSVFSDQDLVQFDVDTRNDEKSSFIFRVNPLGVPADAIFSESTGLDDFSPDFSFHVVARIVEDGWIAEFRVPLSTLRYPPAPVQEWGLTFYRNYPREFRYQMTSNPIPRGANCWLCYSRKLTGIEDLPASRYSLFVPYATAQGESNPESDDSTSWNGGMDLKWIPKNELTLDATLNPDFAQVEADIPQIAVNNRFSLFYPEKRGFFLEGADLLTTPLDAIYTRTITSPAWGVRATGQTGSSAYTLLVTEDEGGGSRIEPGPAFSRLVPQPGRSYAVIGRWRASLGNFYTGIVFTDREYEAGFNRILGPDIQWRPNETHRVIAQWLVSSTQDPDQKTINDSAAALSWQYSTPSRLARLDYERLGHGFRADNGFVPQVGIERKSASLGYRFYPEGWLRLVQPGFTWDSVVELGDRAVSRATYPSLQLSGKWNSDITLEYHFEEQVRTGERLLDHSFFAYHVQVRPSRILSSINGSGNLGEQADFANERIGRGGSVALAATLRTGIHLNTEIVAERQWLDIEPDRLFTAYVSRAKVTYNFTPRMFVRTIGQYERIRRNPSLYKDAVEAEEGAWSASILYGFRFNWQTLFYAGYSSDRALVDGRSYRNIGSHFFFKVAYAFEP